MRGTQALLSLLGLLLLGCPPSDGEDSALDPCPGGDVNEPDLCDGEDSDCDGDVDEDAPVRQWYADEDGDGYGGDASSVFACAAPDGYTSEPLDCDDEDPEISPDASEVCGGEDEDCDGLEDEADPSVTGLESYFLDQDGDGLGYGSSFRFCDPPEGYVDNDIDCDDEDAAVLDSLSWYADADGDGFGDASATEEGCEQPEGYVENALDCDDGADAVNPAASETCLNDQDDDCDGTDNGCVPLEGDTTLSAASALLDTTQSYFGGALRRADTDGDGQPEAMTSAPTASSNAGTVYLFEELTPGTSGSESLATMQLFGSSSYSYLGFGLADGADYDADGYEDVAAYSTSSASVLVVDGPISAGDSVDRAGTVVSYSGTGTPNISRRWIGGFDLDDDGAASLLLGCPYCTSSYTYEGAVYLLDDPLAAGKIDVSTDALATIWGNSSGAYFGQDLAELGDTDGDGVGEFAAGSYYTSYGYTYNGLTGVFSGDLSGSLALSDADLLIFGSADYQYAGADVIRAGDVDGDGLGDLAISAYYDTSFTGSSLGATYVFLAPAMSGSLSTARADAAFYGTSSGERFGQQLAAADLNGDGFSDLAMGDYSADSYFGAVHLFYGPIESGSRAESEADAHIVGTYTYNYLGYELASLGDLDLDGYDELGVTDYAGASVGIFFGGSW